MFLDLRHAFRQLVKSPGFTATVLATLALCLGANLTIFPIVDAILVRSLPFSDANRLVTVIDSYPGAGYPRGGASIANYFDRRHAIPAFASVSLFAENNAIIGDAGSPERVPIALVTPEFFATLGVPLAQGRTFNDAAFAHGADQVAVITDEFWRTWFNHDPQILGRVFLNNQLPVTVIGVLPPGFRFLSSRAKFFRPLAHVAEMRQANERHNTSGEMIARLAPGATLAEAAAQLEAFDAHQALDDPKAEFLKGWGYHTIVHSLHADHVREIRPALLLLQGGAILLLLIGLANLVNLLLIRASAHAKEVAVRQALGATRLHLARQILAEIMLLALCGGGLGLLLAAFGLQGVARLGAERLPLGADIVLDVRTAAAGFAATLIGGGLLALPVLWFTLRARPASGLQLESRGGTTSRSAQTLRHGFIVIQIALAFVLLTGAGLLGLSLERVLKTPTGFNAANVLTGQISLPWKSYPDDGSQSAFIARLLPALRALPGVTHVAISNGLPFTGRVGGGVVTIEGRQLAPGEAGHGHNHIGVTSDYWASMNIPLLRGRLLTEADEQRTDKVCVVDQAFADHYWPGGNPLGHRLAYNSVFDEKLAATIVGVVGSVKQKQLSESAGFGAVYFPFSKFGTPFFYVTIRATQSVGSLASSLRKTILQLDPGLPIDDLRPLQDRIDDSLVDRRSPAVLALLFAGVALLLAAIGTYGVLSYAVSQRHREIGIRVALGALPAQIARQFLSLGLRLLTAGLAFGLVGAWLTGRTMQSILFDVSPFPPAALAATAAVMTVTALLACLLPARRATKVDPMVALRTE